MSETLEFSVKLTAFDRDVERLATPLEHPAKKLVDPTLANEIRALLAATDAVARHKSAEQLITQSADDYTNHGRAAVAF